MRGSFLVWLLATDMVRVASGVVCVDLHGCLFNLSHFQLRVYSFLLHLQYGQYIILTQFEKYHWKWC